jgi:hypothetical protein
MIGLSLIVLIGMAVLGGIIAVVVALAATSGSRNRREKE